MDAMDAMDASRLCPRNDSCTAALSETITLSRPRGKRNGGHDSGQHTRNALRIAAARGSARALSCDTASSTYATHIYDTARGSHHDDRPALARLPLDL